MKNRIRFKIAALTVLICFCACSISFAYVGPGAGLSLLGALWGLLIAVGAALIFVIFWPIRRLWKRSKARKEDAKEDSSTQ